MLIVTAMRAIGEEKITEEERNMLVEHTRNVSNKDFNHDIKFAPAWVRKIIIARWNKDKNNHYNFYRKNLNFEIVRGRKFVSLRSNPIPLHEHIQMRLDELEFKPYMDAKHPDQVSKNSPNCTVVMIFSGDHDVLYNLAFGNQRIDTANPDADHSHIVLQQGIYKWAKDTYDFVCRKWDL